jgi:hypothetical protein
VGDGAVEYRRAPRRNEDADYVFSELLGYDSTRIEMLGAASVHGAVLTDVATP